MEAGAQTTLAARDERVDLLRASVPFKTASDGVLSAIAAYAKPVSFPIGTAVPANGNDVYVIIRGRIEHVLRPPSGATEIPRLLGSGEAFGWEALLREPPGRIIRVTAVEDTDCLAIDHRSLLGALDSEPGAREAAMSQLAALAARDLAAAKGSARSPAVARAPEVRQLTGIALTMFRLSQWLASPRPYLMVTGFALFLGFWYLAVEVWKLPRFEQLPGPTFVAKEWLSPDPIYGTSIYSREYYLDIWVSVRRVGISFFLATVLGVPLGLLLGWSQKFKEFVFPVFEILRPIPGLAWVPLAIIMFKGLETPVIFLAFLASFYATALNTMLGVLSVDESYFRAGSCLGANRWQVFRHIIIPGSMPFIFTGLQISIGVCWFSLVAAEMVSGQYGLGYLINTSFLMVRYPTIIIGMVTLGAVGYATSAMVRIAGDYMMQWRVRELALGGGA